MLCLLRSEQGIGITASFVDGIEIVGADDMQVDDGTQVMLLGPIDSIGHQFPSLGQFVALFVPELYFVNWQAHKVKAE